jgi:hypothetical protein
MLAIDGTDAVLLPVGTNVQRPVGTVGLIRYNTDTTQFEGYSSGAWQGLGGVIDIDQDTYVVAEESADEDFIRVYTAGAERLTVSNTGNVGIGTTTPAFKLDVNGTARFVGALTLGSTLDATGATTLSSTLGVTGATTLSSTLGVTGLITGSAGLTIAAGDVSLPTDTIDSDEITDATIVSGDISGSAAITDGQINNDLTIDGGTINDTTIGAATPSTAVFTTATTTGAFTVQGALTALSATITNAFQASSATITGLLTTGTLTVTNTATTTDLVATNSATLATTTITNAAISGELDADGGVDVTGNITVTGTVDGRDVDTDGAKLDGIEASATEDQTAAEILAALITVDGASSDLDADFLDGISSAAFALDTDVDDLSGVTNTTTARTNLGLAIGTNVQAFDSNLTTFAGITPSSNIQSLLAAANYATMRGLLDLEAGTDFYSITAANTAFEDELNNSAGLYAALSDVTQFWEAGDTINTGAVADSVLSANVSLLGSSIDISDETNLVAGTNLTLSGDTLNATFTDTNTQLTAEQVEDFSFDGLTGNTETRITVTYQDADGTVDFVVDNDLANYDNTTSAFLTSVNNSNWSGTDLAVVNGGTGASNASDARTNLGLAIGTNVQAFNANLTTFAGITPSSNIQSLLAAANYATMRGLLDLEAGTDFYSITAANTAFEDELNNSAGLRAALSDETGTGNAVFSTSPTLTGTLDAVAGDFSSVLTMSGSLANIALGSNFLSGDGGDEGVFVATNGNVGIGTTTPSSLLTVAGDLSIDGDILPTTNLTHSLGSSANRFLDVWAETLNVGTSTWSIFNSDDNALTFSSAAEQGGLAAMTLGTGPGASTGAFDVSTASFVDSFSVAAQEALPASVTFSPDGLKMFVMGWSGDAVHEYTLSTTFDVSTASFVDSFDVSGQETNPAGLTFSTDGLKMFVVGPSGDDVNEYTLSTTFDVSTASFVDSFDVSGQETSPTDVAFSPDGLKMFVLGNHGDDVNEYTLSTTFDVSTASFVDSFSVAGQEASPYGIAFSPDGLKMFVLGNHGDDVNEYTLGEPPGPDEAQLAIAGQLSVDSTTLLKKQLTMSGSLANIALGSNFLSGDGDDEGLFVATNGNVGIGDTTPDAKLDVVGDIHYTGTLSDVSDERLKENITLITNNLDKVLGIKPTYFNMIDAPGETEVGFIAQNVQAFAPETVSVMDPDTGHIGVSYSSLIPLAFGAVQEMNAILDFGTSTSTAMTIDEDGNVGIGTTTPAYKLHVVGDVAATAFVNTSTGSLKTGITYLDDEEEADILRKIREEVNVAQYRYTFEDESNPLRMGLIAEEAPSEILSVSGTGVDIYKLATFTLAGVKAQQSQIDALTLRLENLETMGTLEEGTGVLAIITQWLEGIGIYFSESMAKFNNLAATAFTVGSAENPNGITLYDEETGEAFCVRVRDGEMVNEPGECTASTPAEDEEEDTEDEEQGGGGNAGESTGDETGEGTGDNVEEGTEQDTEDETEEGGGGNVEEGTTDEAEDNTTDEAADETEEDTTDDTAEDATDETEDETTDEEDSTTDDASEEDSATGDEAADEPEEEAPEAEVAADEPAEEEEAPAPDPVDEDTTE